MAKKTITGEDGKEYVVKEKKPIYKRPWFIVIVVLLALGVIGNAMNGGKNSNNVAVESSADSPSDEAAPAAKYEISDVNVESDGFASYVTGIIKNNTDSDRTYVQVTFPCYDKDGNKLGDAIDNVNDLGAGKTWKFKAMYLGESVEGMTFDLENAKVEGF